MNVNNNANTINFKGYDARKLKAVVMNTNYAGLADEVKKIGDIENFEVLLLQNKGGRHILKRDAPRFLSFGRVSRRRLSSRRMRGARKGRPQRFPPR